MTNKKATALSTKVRRRSPPKASQKASQLVIKEILSMTQPKQDFQPEDLMSDEFWGSHGIEMITLDPEDESTFEALVQRISDEVEVIQSTQE
jgi:hypothetical protein